MTAEPRDVASLPDVVRRWVHGDVTLEGRPVAIQRFVETHTAVVLVSPDMAFKVRKAVDLGYVRHDTVRLRLDAAKAEFELGRRFSPHVYVGVWSVTEDEPAALVPHPDRGEPVLAMNRLDDALRVDNVMRGRADPARLRSAIDDLVRIHEGLPTDRDPNGRGAPGKVGVAWAREFEYLPFGEDNGLWSETERNRLFDDTREWLAELTPLLVQRAQEGRVREGHGDLRLEHCYLTDPLSLIDPLVFDIAYRFTDVAAEMCFLAMELDEMGRSDASAFVLDRYASLTRDDSLAAVAPFFKRYRAIIRAKVEWIRYGQTEGEEAEHHLERGRALVRLARSYRPAA